VEKGTTDDECELTIRMPCLNEAEMVVGCSHNFRVGASPAPR
jgi:hypothetical protein